MNYKEINYPAIVEFELADDPKVWVWNPTFREWNKASMYNGDDFLHTVGDKPLWKGSLLYLNGALAVLKVMPDLELWYLQNTVWWHIEKDNLPDCFAVYLVESKGVIPKFNLIQREIGKLMYEEYNKQGKETTMKETTNTTQPTPHKHCGSIIAWAKDTSQPVWVWNSISGTWLRDSAMQWLDSKCYAVGEMPLNKPTKTVRIEITRDYTVTGRTFDVPYDATEKDILAEGYKSAQEGVRVSYSILKDNT